MIRHLIANRGASVAALTILGHWFTFATAYGQERRAEADLSPVAVVELFTSEGCSSCPPADKLLAELAAKNVLVLSFHVDYWNQLGWIDPFSQREYSRRQHEYAAVLRQEQVYTPQMIVNGTQAFVGSNRAQASVALKAALSHQAEDRVMLAITERAGTSVTIRYEVTGKPADRDLAIALVQRKSSAQVTSGENKGSTLAHVNSVRAFQSVTLKEATRGSVTLALPKEVAAEDLAVIAYVQARPTRNVTGAATLVLDR